MKKFEELSKRVIGCALEVHKYLGAGLLESAYQQCLARELNLAGIAFEKEVQLPLEYKGMSLDCGYRLDLLVQDELIIEIKAVETLLPIHEAQILTYLKLARKHIGLLMNFHSPLLKQGIKRFVL